MKRWIQATLAGLAALVPAVALAGLDNTHHDMSTPNINVSREKCAFCHSKVVSVTPTGYGSVGNFCVAVCHQGSVTGANIDASGYFNDTFTTAGAATNDPTVVAFTNAHGELPTALTAPDTASAVGATNWPHSSATAAMECTTCHAVHDATNPPFLNGPLSSTAGNTGSFCQRCHTGAAPAAGSAGRFDPITNAGAHPSEVVWNPTTAGTRSGVKSGTPGAYQHGRSLALKSSLLAMTAGAGATVATAVTQFNTTTGMHWNLGGHIMNPTTNLPVASTGAVGFNVGCYTCHTVHNSSTAVNVAATNQIGNILTIGPIGPNANYVGTQRSILCGGCHGTALASIANPGTTTAYHPANDEAASPYDHQHTAHGAVATNPNAPATGSFAVPMSTTFWTFFTTGSTYAFARGANGNITCVSCHDVHGGVSGEMAIRNIGGGVTTSVSVCLACHAGSTTISGANSHHPGQQGINYSLAANGGFGTSAAWATPDGLGVMSDGLSCPDCHVFQGSTTARATAHNW